MPTYEYACTQCRKKFEIVMAVSERESARIRCPKCKSLKVVPRISGFFAKTTKKS